MAKKSKKTAPAASTTRRHSQPIDDAAWFSPAIFVVFILGVVVLFADFFFSNKMLHGSDMIQAGIFFREFLVNSVLGEGHVPQWNPYIFGGMPYVEAFHGDIFYPLSFLKYFGTIWRSLGYVMILHIVLAGIFMYLAARQLRLSRIAALFSAGSYMFAHYLVSLVAPGHDGKMFVTALFPLVIFFLDRGFKVEGILKKLFEFSLFGLVIGFIILSPHPQMSYYTLWAAAFYTIFRMVLAWRQSRSLGKAIIPGSFAFYGVIVGLLLSAIQFYPGFIYTRTFSPRAADDSKSGWEWATSWSIHQEEAFGQFIPEFAGTNTSEATTYYWGKNFFKDNAESVGIIPIFLALIGLFFARRKTGYFFGGVALFAFLYALGSTTPVFYIFYYLMPLVKSLRAPSMIMFIYAFSIALLAGMGVQRIRDGIDSLSDKSQQWFKYLVFGLPGLMLFFALAFAMAGRAMLQLWTSIFYSEAASTMVQQNVSKLDVAMMNLPAIQSGAWFAFLFTAIAALLIWMYQTRKAAEWALVVLILLPVIDGVRFGSRFVGTYDAERHWAASPLTNFFTQKDTSSFRVFNLTSLPPDFLPYFGIQMVTGYHGNQLRWYDALLGGPSKANQTNPRFLNLVGAEYIILPANSNLPPDALGPQPVTTVANFGQLQVAHNPNAFPRVFLVDRYRVFDTRDEIYPALLRGSVDLRRVVYLEQEPPLEIKPDPASTDSTWIEAYDTDSVLVGMTLSTNKILVMTDNYFDAWQVTGDGQPLELMRAFGSFRAVAVPAGTRQVAFVYKSKRYETGKVITYATSIYLLLVIGGVGVIRYRSSGKRQQDEEETA